MFKFDIIESQQQNEGNPAINLVLQKLTFLQKKNEIIVNFDEVAFIVAENKEKGLLGGACLLKKNLSAIQEDVKELVKTPTLYIEGVWECSNIGIEMSPKYTAQGFPESLHFSQIFYQQLYEKLVEFGKKKNIGFVVIKLMKEVYIATKKFGLWPYVVELKPENSADDLFHGVLPLTGSQYKAYKKTCALVNSQKGVV